MGLKAGQAKMSKSDPDSAVFMEDSAVDKTVVLQLSVCVPQKWQTNGHHRAPLGHHQFSAGHSRRCKTEDHQCGMSPFLDQIFVTNPKMP